jgi:hypothetical protein
MDLPALFHHSEYFLLQRVLAVQSFVPSLSRCIIANTYLHFNNITIFKLLSLLAF